MLAKGDVAKNNKTLFLSFIIKHGFLTNQTARRVLSNNLQLDYELKISIYQLSRIDIESE